eukprot:scaffold44016_cov46-Prasinocladus_malaysianus.AAC.3
MLHALIKNWHQALSNYDIVSANCSVASCKPSVIRLWTSAYITYIFVGLADLKWGCNPMLEEPWQRRTGGATYQLALPQRLDGMKIRRVEHSLAVGGVVDCRVH